MAENDAEFLIRLLETFKIEADEHLKGMSSGLLELEKNRDQEVDQEADQEVRAQLIETIFREAHSLKGAARAVNLTAVESLCQALESVFSSMKKKETKPTADLFDLLQQSLDVLARILASSGNESRPHDQSLQKDLIARLGEMVGGSSSRKTESAKEPGNSDVTEIYDQKPQPPYSQLPTVTGTETLRVSAAKLSSVLLQTEEMLSVKLAASQRSMDMRTAKASFYLWKKQWAKVLPIALELRSNIRHISDNSKEPGDSIKPRSLEKMLDFLDWNASFFKSLEETHVAAAKSAEFEGRALGSMVDNLLADMKKVMMFPFSSLLEILPKIIRDLARDSGKEVDLTIHGGEVEIDRRILEGMKDPLLHLVRNCIDHGLEKPEERKRQNKTPRGLITVTVAPRDEKIEVVVSDDGIGISLARVRAAVLKLGTLSKEKVAGLTDLELLPFVFQSGVSTSPMITELSGRGLGLAIVKEKVEKLGGTVFIGTGSDTGTHFRILLPLTVATFRGILVRAGEQTFVIPSMYVERTVRLQREEIRTVENRETISLNGQAVSLARLPEVLGLPHGRKAEEAPAFLQALVLSAAGTNIAFLVDEVIGEQEVLHKGLGRQLSRVRNVAGATVLGNGMAAPVLNVADLMKSAIKVSGSSASRDAASETAEELTQKRTIMVAEDSITTRTLLKNILETAGYEVVTAVDGLDAFTRLKEREFDIVVSDVEMPRMSGFDLTAKIRNDKKLKDLPVILITALESREDRERGIDVGANAYIVKSSFDQSNLLDVLRKLV